MKWRIICAAFFLITAITHAEEKGRQRLLDTYNLSSATGDALSPRLLVATEGEPTLVKQQGPPFLPNRVYGIYNRQEKAWVYTWTNWYGKIPEPLELLYKGTILPGSYIGAKNPFQNFELTANYHWVPTEEKEKQYLLIPSEPNLVKRITYLEPILDPEEHIVFK